MGLILYYIVFYHLLYAPIIIAMALVLWGLGNSVKGVKAKPPKAFAVAAICTVMGVFGRYASYLLLWLGASWIWIVLDPLFGIVFGSILVFLVLIPLCRTFFNADTGEAVLLAIAGAVVYVIVGYSMGWLVDNMLYDFLLQIMWLPGP